MSDNTKAYRLPSVRRVGIVVVFAAAIGFIPGLLITMFTESAQIGAASAIVIGLIAIRYFSATRGR